MKLTDLLADLEFERVQGSLERDVSDVIYDSRKMKKDAVFVCVKGAASDGLDYCGDAIKKGAAAIVAEKEVLAPESVAVIKVADARAALALLSAAYFGHPARELVTIGITGTKGKTTAAYMVRSILEASGIKTGLIGTIEIIIGDERAQSVNTTPESYVVQQSFRKMADAGCKCVVMEASSQGLMMHRVDGFTFDYGIFTNLEPDHIGPNEHKDLDDYIRCKSLLFKRCRHGIFNADDAHLNDMLAGSSCSVETFGFSKDADLRATDERLLEGKGMLGVAYHLSGLMDMDVKIDIPGKFSVYNSMTAISICRHLGVSKDAILKALSGIRVKGRVELLDISPKFTVIIDYAHNAMSLKSLLLTLREYNPKRLVCVFGCGGNRSRERRFEMGETSSRLADLTIITSDNPRFEEPGAIIDDIKAGVRRADGKYITIADRPQAIRYAIENAMEGDIIAIAGKGHEDYQEIKGQKFHLDDREIAMAVSRDKKFIR